MAGIAGDGAVERDRDVDGAVEGGGNEAAGTEGSSSEEDSGNWCVEVSQASWPASAAAYSPAPTGDCSSRQFLSACAFLN